LVIVNRDIAEPMPKDRQVEAELALFIHDLIKMIPEGEQARFFDGFSEPGEVPHSTAAYSHQPSRRSGTANSLCRAA
jgi:hypothetical protein